MALGQGKGLLAHLLHGHAIGKQAHRLQPQPPAGGQGAGHGIGIAGLHPHNPHLGPEAFHVGGNAGDQAAAAHRHIDGIRRRRALAQDLQGDGALAGDHIGVIKGVDEAEAALLFQAPGFAIGGVVGVAMEHHLGAPGGHRPHLHLRRGDRHHDHGLAPQALGAQGHALGVVAGAGGDHAPLQFLRREARHLVVSAAQLEAEHRLQVFPFKQHGVVQAPRQVGGGIQGRFDRHVIDPGPQDPLQHVATGLHRCGAGGVRPACRCDDAGLAAGKRGRGLGIAAHRPSLATALAPALMRFGLACQGLPAGLSGGLARGCGPLEPSPLTPLHRPCGVD